MRLLNTHSRVSLKPQAACHVLRTHVLCAATFQLMVICRMLTPLSAGTQQELAGPLHPVPALTTPAQLLPPAHPMPGAIQYAFAGPQAEPQPAPSQQLHAAPQPVPGQQLPAAPQPAPQPWLQPPQAAWPWPTCSYACCIYPCAAAASRPPSPSQSLRTATPCPSPCATAACSSPTQLARSAATPPPPACHADVWLLRHKLICCWSTATPCASPICTAVCCNADPPTPACSCPHAAPGEWVPAPQYAQLQPPQYAAPQQGYYSAQPAGPPMSAPQSQTAYASSQHPPWQPQAPHFHGAPHAGPPSGLHSAAIQPTSYPSHSYQAGPTAPAMSGGYVCPPPHDTQGQHYMLYRP